MEDRQHAVAFTGHRDLDKETVSALCEKLYRTVEELYQKGYTDYYCGGALGFDTLAALTVLNMKTTYPNLTLTVAVPCPEQAKRWQESDRLLYESILQRADHVEILCEHYTRFCMMLRNRYMVDHASLVIAYMQREEGGTAATVRYAKKKGVSVINLAE